MMTFYKKRRFIINFLYFSICSLIIFVMFKFLFIYFLPFSLGIIISYLVQKPALLISKKIKINKSYCASIISVLLFIAITLILFILFYFVYLQFNDLLISLKNNKNFSINIFIDYLNNFFKKSNFDFNDTLSNLLVKSIERTLLKVSDFLSAFLSSVVKKTPNLLISATITIVSTFYISKDFDKLKSFIRGIINENLLYRVIKIRNVFFECFTKILVGYFIIYLITFIELLIGFSFLKIGNKFLLALFIAIIDIMPILGTGTVLIPWAIFEFLNNNYKFGIGMCVLYILITLVRNFVEPKIIANQIDINPIFTLFFILLGLRFGGIFGMILVPIILTVIFTYLRRENSTERTDL